MSSHEGTEGLSSFCLVLTPGSSFFVSPEAATLVGGSWVKGSIQGFRVPAQSVMRAQVRHHTW